MGFWGICYLLVVFFIHVKQNLRISWFHCFLRLLDSLLDSFLEFVKQIVKQKAIFSTFCHLLDSFGEFCFLSSNMSSKRFCRRGIVKQKKQWLFCYLLDSLLDCLLGTLQIHDFVELSDSFWELSSKLSSKSQIHSIVLLFVFFAIANLLGGGGNK